MGLVLVAAPSRWGAHCCKAFFFFFWLMRIVDDELRQDAIKANEETIKMW